MGVSVNLLVNAKNGVREIRKLLEGLGYKIKGEYLEDHAFLLVKHRGQESQLYIAHSTDYGGLDGTIISSGSRKPNIELFEEIAQVLGGFLQEQDCSDQWTGFQEPHNGNARFVLDHVILSQAISKSDELSDKVAKAIDYDKT